MSTIAAISTAPGIGGIGIVRMSGKECFDILDKIFKPISDKPIKGYSIKYGKIYDNDELIFDKKINFAKKGFDAIEDVLERNGM